MTKFISGHDLSVYFPDIREPDMKILRASEHTIKQEKSPYYLFSVSHLAERFKQIMEIPPHIIRSKPA